LLIAATPQAPSGVQLLIFLHPSMNAWIKAPVHGGLFKFLRSSVNAWTNGPPSMADFSMFF
jgi:hypothetical protein